MALACNIDSAGKAARFRIGLILLGTAAAVTLIWPLRTGSAGGWLLAAALAAGGAFSVFEARAGWCVVRALGFRTRI
jgi:hypothetical protein